MIEFNVAKHSTWAGKFYNTFFDCFRLLFLVSIVDNTFGGKTEGDLECDTQGIENNRKTVM